jgi:hypothetical protein
MLLQFQDEYGLNKYLTSIQLCLGLPLFERVVVVRELYYCPNFLPGLLVEGHVTPLKILTAGGARVSFGSVC